MIRSSLRGACDQAIQKVQTLWIAWSQTPRNDKLKGLNRMRFFILILITALLTACKVGPNYVQPSVEVPARYKEADKYWKVAQPRDDFDRGEWWKIFNDPDLNALEAQVNVSNQSLAAAVAAYEQAEQLVKEARAGLFPTVDLNASVTRQRGSSSFTTTSSSGSPSTPSTSETSPSGVSGGSNSQTNTEYSLSLSGSWVPDIWGNVRRQIEQNQASAEATAAQLAATRLSLQTTLAQDYFQLRVLDLDQKILDDTVAANRRFLDITRKSYQQGVSSLTNIAAAENQLKTSEAAAIDNRINRATFEHAIAVLIGKPPANFSIKPKYTKLKVPQIPLIVPSELLERRPDIAQAERNVAAANAAIGVAVAAYFPNIAINGTYGYQTFSSSKLFDQSALFWSIGPQLAQTLIDGGLRRAQVAAARANYRETVANYRQTVLAAFQNVEDDLVTLRILNEEVVLQKQAADAQELSLKMTLDNYQQGTASMLNVLPSETTYYIAKKTYYDTIARQLVAAVALISALGGGWDTEQLKAPLQFPYKQIY